MFGLSMMMMVLLANRNFCNNKASLSSGFSSNILLNFTNKIYRVWSVIKQSETTIGTAEMDNKFSGQNKNLNSIYLAIIISTSTLVIVNLYVKQLSSVWQSQQLIAFLLQNSSSQYFFPFFLNVFFLQYFRWVTYISNMHIEQCQKIILKTTTKKNQSNKLLNSIWLVGSD